MNKKIILLSFMLLCVMQVFAQIKGIVSDENGEPLVSASVVVQGHKIYTVTDDDGAYTLNNLPKGTIRVTVSYIGFQSITRQINMKDQIQKVDFRLSVSNVLSEIEVFGERNKQPAKLDAITRMPLRPSEQIQSISVISDKVISEQGALSVTDAARNVPGVSLFGSYGGIRESMSIRGYRGVPILKNGVGIDSDFRTASLTSDMQGVESVQIIKGSAAITQGIGNGLGSPGGVINVVTKTPKFVNSGEVAFRTGSWGQVRPTFDVQTVLNKKRNVAFRLNGAFERADSYRKYINSNQIYINPSLEWRPDDKTIVALELDYFNQNKTPDRGTVNLAADSVEALYKLPYDRFLGFSTDNAHTKTTTYAARVTRFLTDNIYVRGAYFKSDYSLDNTGASLSSVKGADYNMRARTLARSLRDDNNSTLQLDLIGKDLYTGPIRHTFQVGFDYKTTDLTTTSYTSAKVDTIDVTQNFTSTLPVSVQSLKIGTPVYSTESNYGLMAQEVMSFNRYLKAVLGLRYSYSSSENDTSTGTTTGDSWNPMFGLMLTPVKNVNLFGSYTTTTSLRSAAQKKEDGTAIGSSNSKQWEFGIKSDWLDNRLRFNFTYFYIKNSNTSYSVYDESGVNILYYDNAGDLVRDGVEVELNGRVLPNLQVMLGYAYVDPRYKNSPAFKEGSAPINTTKNTANAWLYYSVERGFLKGLSLGAGAYYVGKRPVNDYTITVAVHNTTPNVKPFDMPAYTTINAQVAYTFKHLTTRVFFNNIFDEIGYSSYYRGGYINQIDPRNFAVNLSYSF